MPVDREFLGKLEASPHIGALLLQQEKRFSKKTFVFFPDIEAEFSYEQFVGIVRRAATKLAADGLARGDRVCLLLRNTPEFLALYLAALFSGIVVVPINPDLVADEFNYIVEDCGAKVLYFDAGIGSRTPDGAQLPGVTLRPTASLADVAPEGPVTVDAPQPLVGDDVAEILYTSGTTGKPKGVILTHTNLLADSLAVANCYHFSEETRTLGFLPFFHNSGQVVSLLAPLWVGGSTVIVDGKSSLMSLWALVQEFEVHWTLVMAPVLSILLTIQRARRVPTMRGIMSGGQVLTPAVQQAFERDFGVPIFDGFGLTETTLYSTANPYPAEKRRPGSVGAPLPINELSIRDDSGAPVPSGQEGEIWIRGLNVAKGYFGLEEYTRQRFQDGWLRTGDYGFLDSDGYLFFRGRRDDMIKKGGEMVYPAEVENVLQKHEAVLECAVIGVPDPLLGQDLCAFAKLDDRIHATEEDLKRFCATRLAQFKQPKRIIILNYLEGTQDIPKGPTRKVLYRELRELYQRLSGPAATGAKSK